MLLTAFWKLCIDYGRKVKLCLYSKRKNNSTLNVICDQCHKISRDTLKGKHLWWFWTFLRLELPRILTKFPLVPFVRQRIPFNVLYAWVYVLMRYSGFSIIQTAECHYNLNTARISKLVWRSEQAINTVLHNRRNDRYM